MVAGDQSTPVDCLIIGGGPGGYVAAIRAAQLGRSVTLVERSHLGGTCLNEGCIPSKALARFAAAAAAVRRLEASGMPALSGTPDLVAFQKVTMATVGGLVKGVTTLLDGAGVKVLLGNARFVGRTRVCVETGPESVVYIDFKDVVIATGSEPIGLHELPFDGGMISDPSHALEWDSIPGTLVLFGDDYIAVELAVAYARLGSRVTLATKGDRLLPDFDTELAAAALRGARAEGVTVLLATNPLRPDREGVAVVGPDGESHLPADRVVVAAGRSPRLADLDLAAAGMTTAHGFLEVDSQLRIDRHVFAIGDVTPGLPLANRAMMQGRVLGEILGGRPAGFDATVVPRAVFSEPELASVGATEIDAAAAGQSVRVARFPLAALGRAVIESASGGFVKLLLDDANHLVGAQVAGPGATEIIAGLTLAIEMGASADDLALTIHAHPTIAEAAMEAAEVALGRPIHVRPRR